jgi:CxxC motif-containing protein (DUF1111 family)
MRKNPFLAVAAVCGSWLVPFSLSLGATPRDRYPDPDVDRADATPLLGSLSGLTDEQRTTFVAGREEFIEVETVEEGLGPMFNGKSCGECHAHPSVGGSSSELRVSVEVRIGMLRDGVFDPLREYGGPVLQQRSVLEDGATCAYPGEVVPPAATLVSRRATPPLFGAGLMEAIPTSQILARSDPQDRNGDGISGRPNLVLNPESGQMELARFGWKAHVPTLHLFAADAYLNEMGITNPTFPHENLPPGETSLLSCDPIPETGGALEDDGSGVDGFTDFMRLLAPLQQPRAVIAEARFGQRAFNQTGCANCHVPRMQTGGDSVAALRGQTVSLYSDLLLHDMGPDLADGIEMGVAGGSEWRTTPLWGVSQKLFLLHDGRARTLEEAIALHGGEAAAARARFLQLAPRERSALLSFLKAL